MAEKSRGLCETDRWVNQIYDLASKIDLFHGQCYLVMFNVHYYRKGSHSHKDTHIHYLINSVNYMNGKYLLPDAHNPRLFKRHIMKLYENTGLKNIMNYVSSQKSVERNMY